MATHIFTSAAANYIGKARVLAGSVRRFHPDWKIHLVLCDETPAGFTGSPHFDSILKFDDLDIPDLKSWLFQHTLVEASTAVKGFALQKILALAECERVLYFDPDIVVLSSLDSLTDEFERSSILLTPHLSEPEIETAAIVDNELSVLRHGIYNLGFVGVKNSLAGQRFASWWADRLQDFCFDDIPRGLFTDQRWADLVPAYFPDCAILRDAAYNVCTWNLNHRTVTGSMAEGLLVNGRPIGFYHFSGFDSGAQEGMLDRYGSSMPALFELRQWYVEACKQMDHQDQFSELPWAYDFFENGERILQVHRRRYRDLPALQSSFPNPFSTAEEAENYLAWFNLHCEPLWQGVLQSPAISDSEPIPEYRIILIATREDADFLLDTANRILRSSFRRSELWVLASSEAQFPGPLPPEFSIATVEETRYSGLFAAALERFPDRDLLIVRAGASPPSFWDLRLAWSAARQPGALSVSPIDRRTLDSSGIFGKLDDKTLDRYCYWYRRSSDEETGSLETDCVYIRAAALQDLGVLPKPLTVADLVTRGARLHYTNLLATHVCVGWNRPRQTSDELEIVTSNRWSVRQLRDTIRTHTVDARSCPIAAVTPGTPPTLHVSHSWGGGVERWLYEFTDADKVNDNLVLKSQGPEGVYGCELGLYRYTRPGVPPKLLQVWPLKPSIKATDLKNESYASALRDIYREYRFGKILVASLIGHSLECLRQPVPTAVVCHDYYPFCSAVNLTFGEVCSSCETPRLRACLEENPFNHSFPNVPAPEWLRIREEFVELVWEREIPLIAPSPSMRENYGRVLPELSGLLRLIPHGTRRPPCGRVDLSFDAATPLRILILGSMAIHKGRLLLEALLPELLEFAELTLAGSFDFADRFLPNPRIRVIPSYDRESLCHLVEEIRPDVGLLLSVVPEAFSYTLHELQSMGVPPVATRIGSFESWIQHGENGFLVDPQPASLLALLRSFRQDKRPLEAVHHSLRSFVLRSPEEMVRDYRRLSETRYSSARYFSGPSAPPPLSGRGLQLYWRTRDKDFSEQNSMIVLPLGSERQTARLYYVTPGDSAAELRLDLATEPGFLLVHDLRLLGRKDETLWSINEHLELLRAERLAQCFILDLNVRESGVLFCLTGEDPYITLPIPVELLIQSQGAGSIEVDFTPEPKGDYLAAVARSAQAYDAARNEFEVTAASVAARQDRWVTLENELNEKEQLLNAQRLSLSELGQAFERVHGELSESELARLRATEQLREQEEALRSARAYMEHVTQSLHNVQGELAQREQLVGALQESLSWKLTRPLRDVARLGRKLMNGNRRTDS